MIRIQVTSHNGAPLSQPLFAEFNESGGNIGRAEGNALVLHDSARIISRTHASVAFRGGEYLIRNLGTATPVYVNGQPLVNGRDAAIAVGDEIRIGGYMMQVAKPLGDLPGASSVPASPVSSDIIPSDFDPLAVWPPLTSYPRPISAPPHAPQSNDILDLEFGPLVPNQSIGELYDLSPEKNFELFPPGSPLAPALDQSDKASVDPLVALGIVSRQKPAVGPAQRDDVLELHRSYRPPEAKADPAMRAVLPGAPPPGGVSSSEPYGMVLSWENKEAQDTDEITSVIVPSPGEERRKSERRSSEQRPVAPRETVPEKVTASATGAALASGPATMRVVPVDVSAAPKSITDRDALMREFLAGAGVPDLAIPAGLTPEFMNTLGQLLRESTQGTLDLLRARTHNKLEVRAELTMIAPWENNPLKFSPGVEVALAHLLTPQGRGFMTPLQAMRDAHDDLRSHQFGFMAGMLAALAGVLERFNPRELEQQLTQKTVIDSLFPINRKAKLWDLFADRYEDISHEAEENFHILFSKEFRRAYEAQITKLEQDDKSMKP